MDITFSKHHACHGIINNAPDIVVIMATSPVLMTREFNGAGAPTSSTLNAGKGSYCASKSGFVLAATFDDPGTDYAPGDVLTGSGGTATTQPQITVDAVDATGEITDFRFTRAGVYTVYPTNSVAFTGGSGTGATFNLAFQPEDHYLDTTANVLYACTTAGSKSTSVWTQISGAGGFRWASAGKNYDKTHSFVANEFVVVLATDPLCTTLTTDPDSGGEVFATPGRYLCLQTVTPVVNPSGLPAGTYYRIPQAQMPSGDDDVTNAINYWQFWGGTTICG
jgi:hypothetical protein